MNLDFRSAEATRGARMFAMAAGVGSTCGDCRYAQPFAVQPRGALCVNPQLASGARSVKLDLPACAQFMERPATDLGLMISTPQMTERRSAVA